MAEDSEVSYELFDFVKSPTPADHSCRILSYVKGIINIGFLIGILVIVNEYCIGCNETLVDIARAFGIVFGLNFLIAGAYLFASYMEYELLKSVMSYLYIILTLAEFGGWIVLQVYIYDIDPKEEEKALYTLLFVWNVMAMIIIGAFVLVLLAILVLLIVKKINLPTYRKSNERSRKSSPGLTKRSPVLPLPVKPTSGKYKIPKIRIRRLINHPLAISNTKGKLLAAPPTPVGSISQEKNTNKLMISLVNHTPTFKPLPFPTPTVKPKSRALTPMGRNCISNYIRFNPALRKLRPVGVSSRNNIDTSVKILKTAQEGMKGIRSSLIHKGISLKRIKPGPICIEGKSRNTSTVKTEVVNIVTANKSVAQAEDSVENDSDCMTVIENECENDYSLICSSLNRLCP